MPGMTDRDHFAAAALTGLLANEGDGPVLSQQCEYAYRIADAMLRERERTATSTNHDAAPAARAGTPGTGDTREPVAWGVCWSHDVLDCEFVYEHRDNAKAVADERNGSIAPLYRQPQPTLTDAEREAICRASQYLSQNDVFEGMAEDAATLRGLLERLGGAQ